MVDWTWPAASVPLGPSRSVPAEPPFFRVIVALYVRLSTFVRVTDQVARPGSQTYIFRAPVSGSADVTTTLIFWPRAGVPSETAIANAFISTLADWLIANCPESAVTDEVYTPRGRSAPLSFRPFQLQVWVPAATGASDRWV